MILEDLFCSIPPLTGRVQSDAIITTEGTIVYTNESGRQVSMRIGRYLKKVMPSDWADKEIEELTYKIKVFSNPDKYEIEIVPNVGEYYESIECSEWCSDSRSCMSRKPAEWFEIYEDLGCKLLLVREKNEDRTIIGRALFWDNNLIMEDSGRESVTMVDRIFKAREDVLYFIQGWAVRNNYAYKCGGGIMYKGNYIEVYTEEKCYIEDYEYFPYIDTLCYYESGKFYSKSSRNSIKFETSNGTSPLDGLVWCEYGEEYIDNDDAVYIEYGEYMDCYINVEHATLIEFGVGEGCYAFEEDVIWSDANEGYCLK